MYPLPFMTREVFDLIIIVVIGVGLVAAAIRLRADLTRPLPPEIKWETFNPDDDTQPNKRSD